MTERLCNPTVYGDGTTDARTDDALALSELFYQLNPDIESYRVTLKVTRTINNGVRDVSSTGQASLKLTINEPPEMGTCTLAIQEGLAWVDVNDGRALVDEYLLSCTGWVDPNDHDLVKYRFTGRNQ